MMEHRTSVEAFISSSRLSNTLSVIVAWRDVFMRFVLPSTAKLYRSQESESVR